MPREVEDQDGVRWTCAQAYAGLSEENGASAAARIDGTDRFRVICTPSGGSRSVELELPEGWEEFSDERMLEQIRERKS